MVNDPNWLLSTTVQGSATVVAVVGGFIASQAITTAGEIRNFKSQRRELEAQLKEAANVYQRRVENRISGVVDKFHQQAVEAKLFDERGLSGQELFEHFLKLFEVDYLEDEIEALKGVSEELAETYRTTLAELESKLDTSQIPTLNNEFLKSLGIKVEGTAREIYIQCLAILRREGIDRGRYVDPVLKNSRPAFLATFEKLNSFQSVSPLNLGLLNSVSNSKPRKSESDLKAEVTWLEQSIARIDAEIGSRASQQKPKFLIGSLVYMSIIGIIFPTILMAWQPVPDQLSIRVGLVALLVLGYVLFGIALFRSQEK